MITSVEQFEKVRDSMGNGGGGEGDPTPAPVTNEQRQGWNQYVQFLKKRGIAGDPKLDTNGLGKNLFNQYLKENPNSPLTPDSIIPIQHDFANYRQWAINNIKAGKGAFADGTNEDNFMKELSRVDGYPGQYTTRHEFPKEYLQTFADKKLVNTEDKGFATAKN